MRKSYQINLRDYLSEVVNDLREPIASSIFGGGFGNVYVSECVKCKSKIVANVSAVKKSNRAICFNSWCQAHFSVNIDDAGNPVFRLIATDFECLQRECVGLMTIENRLLDLGVSMVCPVCKLCHKIVERQWGYELVNNPST